MALSDVLVTTEWVNDHKQDENVRLVEVDVDTSAYEQGHIPGATAWNWTTELNDQVRRDILSKEQFAQLLGASGITPETQIVLYGDNNNWFAAYAYWQLKVFGHKELKLVNGGRKKWELEGRALVKEVPDIAHASYPVPTPDPDESIRAKQVEVFAALNAQNTVLVDVRSPLEFSGEVIAPPGMTETAQRGGHIPGAINVPWSKAVNENGTFKAEAELKALYNGVNVSSDKDVITYCRIGERSAHTWFVLQELLGFPNVKNYDGSWTEWGSMVGVPIER
jgi:thiosulfate/3-mercaptopyruvate sulfurtransferase